MPSHRFRILNVFAETALGGNPLAIVLNLGVTMGEAIHVGGRVIEIGRGEIELP